MTKENAIELNNKFSKAWIYPNALNDEQFEKYFNLGRTLKIFTEDDVSKLREMRKVFLAKFNHPMYYEPTDMFELEEMCYVRGEDLKIFDEWDEYITKVNRYFENDYENTIFKNDDWEATTDNTNTKIYFTKNGNDWIFGVYNKQHCLLEKKCHEWHEPTWFADFVAENLTDEWNESNVDCAYID